MLPSFLPIPPDSPFPVENLPLGRFTTQATGRVRACTVVGDQILDLSLIEACGLLGPCDVHYFGLGDTNEFLAAGKEVWTLYRRNLQRLLHPDEPKLRDDAGLLRMALTPLSEAEMLLPCAIGDYTDFYASRDHATNVGVMLRGPENALPPNWLHLPIGYHGRASSIVPSGTPVKRPSGQFKPAGAEQPIFGPTRSLDFELEVAAVVGVGNTLGQPIPIGSAEDHIYGLVLLNDWSARDVQAWEYAPLGPFLGKNFCTTISPWIVPLAALEPFRSVGPKQDPEPLEYLRSSVPGGFNLTLEATLNGQRITATNLSHLYWSFAQMVAHHTVGGCNLRPGDLLASGTVSGPTPESRACLLELSWRGSQPLTLANGQSRSFLEDGDELTLTGYAQGPDYRIGFGTTKGRVGGDAA